MPNFFGVEVAMAKNHPKGFSFCIPVDVNRPYCVGTFFADYSKVMGITLGDPKLFFACKFAKLRGVLTATPAEKVATSTMRNCCKHLISAAWLDPTEYATHSSKRGGALEAMRMGLSDAQIQELGRWSSSTMVARYARGDEEVRTELANSIRI
jgi:hypothetical protein